MQPLSPDPTPKSKEVNWSNLFNRIIAISTIGALYYARQSVKISKDSVEISSQALELTRNSISSSDSTSERSLIIANQTATANIELAKLTKENLELSKKASSAQLEQYRENKDKYYNENVPYITFEGTNFVDYSIGHPIRVGLKFKNLRNQVVKAVDVSSRIVVVDKKFIDLVSNTDFKGLRWLDSTLFSSYPELAQKYKFSLDSDFILTPLVRSPMLIADNANSTLTAETLDILTDEVARKIKLKQYFVFGSGFIVYKNFFTKKYRALVYVYFIEDDIGDQGIITTVPVVIFADNMNYDIKRHKFFKSDL